MYPPNTRFTLTVNSGNGCHFLRLANQSLGYPVINVLSLVDHCKWAHFQNTKILKFEKVLQHQVNAIATRIHQF